MNTLYFGDNLAVLRKHVRDESVDLIYLDPPFNSKVSYNVLYKSPVGADAQRHAFEDSWRWDTATALALEETRERDIKVFNVLRAFQAFLGQSDMMAYLVMMAVRLVELRRVLKPTGSIFLHCDPTASHYLKIILDTLFGAPQFVNEIVWKRSDAHNDAKQGAKHFGRVHDTLLFYRRSDAAHFNAGYNPLPQSTVDKWYRHVEEGTGRRYNKADVTGPGGAAKGNPHYEWNGKLRYWRYSLETMQRLQDEGRLVYTSSGMTYQKRYLDESKGVPIQDVWDDIPMLRGLNASGERIGYPTQKPLALLQRIIETCSSNDDLILDPFCGCGTAIHAAEVARRRWIGIDVAYPAIQVIEDRFKTWLPLAQFEVDGIPKDEFSARKLAEMNPHVFQEWAVGRLGGQPRGKGPDKGIDGEIAFMTGASAYGRGIISVKGGRHVGPSMVRDLKGVVQREEADIGIFVCLDVPTKDMKAEAAASGVIELPGGMRSRVQIVTAKELVAGPDIGVRTQLNVVAAAQHARAVARRKSPKRPSPEKLRREPELPPMALQGGKKDAVQPTLGLAEPLLSNEVPTKRRKRS